MSVAEIKYLEYKDIKSACIYIIYDYEVLWAVLQTESTNWPLLKSY